MSRTWDYLNKAKYRIAGLQCIFVFAVVLLLNGDSLGEHISIAIKKNDKWEARFDYGRCDINMAGGGDCILRLHRVGIREILSQADELGINGYLDDGTVHVNGQGFDALESILEHSQCCEIAEIIVRAEDGSQYIYFSLEEKSDHHLGTWTISLYGDEIVSSSETQPRKEKGIAHWRDTDLSLSRSSNQSGAMEAVLTESDEGFRKGGIVFIHEGYETEFTTLILAPSLVVLLLSLFFVRNRGPFIARIAALAVGGVVGWVVGVLLAYAMIPYEPCPRGTCYVDVDFLLRAYPLVMICIVSGMIIAVVVVRRLFGKRISSDQTGVLSY